ncbi:MAG: helix-turn-helix domain-containing protein [Cyclobacteriaceae bacterium]|nr:helix-turn-helix domain-containing protein [Cyclobacteriaceae bacterium]
MEHYGLTEEQVFRGYLRRIFQDDLNEIKNELRGIRKELERFKPSLSDELLTMSEVCKALKLSRPSVNNLIHKKKKLRPVQLLDQDFRFLRKDIEAMIADSYKDLAD